MRRIIAKLQYEKEELHINLSDIIYDKPLTLEVPYEDEYYKAIYENMKAMTKLRIEEKCIQLSRSLSILADYMEKADVIE